ncbi:H-NS family nucleoid-associated regulatory protein [Herbaspirillum sp. RV1423]|uniref:H-NS histone family protein n=1 Tax=Herbaspirillum sp. RV1423 TaxID=1443993 RepID=UPI0004B2B12F|nr:H-NS histone family protein [Herbaspirillum sp. RV1423]
MAVSELDKLLAQQAEIAKKIEDVKQKERQPIIDSIKSMISEYGFTAKELGLTTKKSKTKKTKGALEPLYRNEENLTWAGRGRIPSWLKGPDGQVSEKLKKKYAITQ